MCMFAFLKVRILNRTVSQKPSLLPTINRKYENKHQKRSQKFSDSLNHLNKYDNI